jgi:hypothetical protein
MTLIVAVGETMGSKITADYLHEYLPGNPTVFNDAVDDYKSIKVGIRRGWIIPFGYASEKISPSEFYNHVITAEPDLEFLRSKGCNQVLNSPAVLPDGRVSGCCSIFNEDNHSLVMGNWPQQSLREIMEAGDDDLLLNWIKFEGPFGIKDYIQKNAPEIPFNSGYAGICHLCGDLLQREDTRAFLQEHLHEVRDHILMLKLNRITGLNMPIGCVESRMRHQRESRILQQKAQPRNLNLTQLTSHLTPSI